MRAVTCGLVERRKISNHTSGSLQQRSKNQTANLDFPFWRFLVNIIIYHFQQHARAVCTVFGGYFWCYCFDLSKIRHRNKAEMRLMRHNLCCLHGQDQLTKYSLILPKIFWPTGSIGGAQGLSAQAFRADLAGDSGGSTHRWSWGGAVHWHFHHPIFQMCSDMARQQVWKLVSWCLQGLQQPCSATWPNTSLEFLCLALYPSLFSNFTLGFSTSLEKRKSPLDWSKTKAQQVLK